MMRRDTDVQVRGYFQGAEAFARRRGGRRPEDVGLRFDRGLRRGLRELVDGMAAALRRRSASN